MEHWELVVRERVRDTVARYAHAADGGRAAELADSGSPASERVDLRSY